MARRIDSVTDSMRRAIDETERRRLRQAEFNREHGIVPQGVQKQVKELIDGVYNATASRVERLVAGERREAEAMSEAQLGREIKRLERQMLELAKNLEFEKAARVRDQLGALRERVFIGQGAAAPRGAAAEKVA